MNLTQVRFLHQQCSLQTSLDNLSTWVREHKMKMNSRKCKALHICFARTPPTPEPLLIDGQTLEIVFHIKVLGVTVQSDLKWDIQVDNMISASNRKLFLFNTPTEEVWSYYSRPHNRLHRVYQTHYGIRGTGVAPGPDLYTVCKARTTTETSMQNHPGHTVHRLHFSTVYTEP
ncbi:hypothetical protein Bbelb_083060 [Branchiostoma belcheri]|nr:hypothetical protein Bbelb_083060 [Branchiostoma belcheri]